MRVNAWVSGGAIPASQQGKKLTGLTTIWDWYRTFAAIAGVDPTDHAAAEAKLPPVEGIHPLTPLCAWTAMNRLGRGGGARRSHSGASDRSAVSRL